MATWSPGHSPARPLQILPTPFPNAGPCLSSHFCSNTHLPPCVGSEGISVDDIFGTSLIEIGEAEGNATNTLFDIITAPRLLRADAIRFKISKNTMTDHQHLNKYIKCKCKTTQLHGIHEDTHHTNDKKCRNKSQTCKLLST